MPRFFLFICFFSAAVLCQFGRTSFAEEAIIQAADKAPAKKTKGKAQPPIKPEIAQPLQLKDDDLVTFDGVQLIADFAPGNADRNTVPVLLLHGERKDRKEFAPLLEEFKKRGYAVLSVDLRGHGESTQKYDIPLPNAPNLQPNDPNNPAPKKKPKLVDYTAADFTPDDFANMLRFDPSPIKRFLIYQHNQGKLNLSKLVIIGSDMGASLAVSLGHRDWIPSGGPYPSRDTKVVVMISPRDEPPILQSLDAKLYKDNVAFLALVGKINDTKAKSAAAIRAKYFGKVQETADLGIESKFPVLNYATEKQGGDLLELSSLEIPKTIADFIDARLAKRKPNEIKWIFRPQM